MGKYTLNDLFLPKKLAYHVKILIGGFFITAFFNIIWKGTPISSDFLFLYVLVIFQLEIFMFLALKIFTKTEKSSSSAYKKEIIFKLLKFYLVVLLIAVLLLFLIVVITSFFGGGSFSNVMDHFINRELKPFLISWAIGMALGSLVFFYMEWNNSLKREQKLREEKLIFKYETLKNQVNPHFLFNSLNTLSSLVSKDAGLSEKFIQKFSSIYRYILENNDVEFVSLEKELNFVQDYFYLQEIRDKGKINLKIDIGQLGVFKVIPISIQLLVENALKHNSASVDNPLTIDISIEEDYLVVKNELRKKAILAPPSKKGLNNLKERIKLILNKDLEVIEKENLFVVKLPLKKK